MNCEATRDLLPEHALGVSGLKARAISEHLSRCAACRKESRDLQSAAATMAFALAPEAPPLQLEDAVVSGVRSAAGVAAPPRRPRRGLTLAVAAALALAGIGGGAVIAGRDPGPTPEQVAQERDDGLNALERFKAATLLADGETEATLAVLLPVDGAPGGGSAMTLMAPTIRDRTIVTASGLQEERKRLPYSVWLADAGGRFIKVGRVDELNSSGGFTVARIVRDDLAPFVNVLVRDGRGKVVLTGTLSSDATLPTPSG